jgi:hypothetical protein
MIDQSSSSFARGFAGAGREVNPVLIARDGVGIIEARA